jgi:uncharacterized protein YdgA (DUF945 family)
MSGFRNIGVMGGMGPAATADFLGKLLALSGAARDQDHPRILVDCDPTIPERHAAIRGEGPSPAPRLVAMAEGLERAGAEVLCMPCNTAHAFEADIRAATKLPFVSITEQTYDKHFFTSTSRTTLQFGCPAGGKPLPTATITSTIRHGPIAGAALAAAVIDTEVRIAAGDDDGKRLVAAFGAAAPLAAHTVVALDGRRSTSTLTSPAVRVALGTGAELEWQGLTGEVGANGDGRAVTYRLKSPGLTITDPAHQASMRLAGLALQGEGQAIAPGSPFTVGSAQGSVDTVAISGGGAASPMKAAFNGLAFTSTTALDGELVGGTSAFTGTGTVGDVKLDKIEMKMSLKRVHMPSYQRVMETFTKEVYRCDAAGKAPDLAALQAKVQGDLMAMLRHGPEVSIDRIAVESGGLTGELSYGFGVEGVTEGDAALPMPALLMAHGRAHAATRLPIAWLRRLSQTSAAQLQGRVPDPASLDVMLESAQAQGWVVRDGDYVKGELSFAKGALTVNGKALGAR